MFREFFSAKVGISKDTVGVQFVQKDLVKNGKTVHIVVVVYVDDLVFFESDLALLEEIIDQFPQHFKGADQGEISFYLGSKMLQERGYVALSQTAYIDPVLDMYGMNNCTPYAIPMLPSCHDDVSEHADDAQLESTEFRHFIGCLLFLGTRTRTTPHRIIGLTGYGPSTRTASEADLTAVNSAVGLTASEADITAVNSTVGSTTSEADILTFNY